MALVQAFAQVLNIAGNVAFGCLPEADIEAAYELCILPEFVVDMQYMLFFEVIFGESAYLDIRIVPIEGWCRRRVENLERIRR